MKIEVLALLVVALLHHYSQTDRSLLFRTLRGNRISSARSTGLRSRAICRTFGESVCQTETWRFGCGKASASGLSEVM